MSLDDPAEAARARLTPTEFIAGVGQPAILDEIQYAPELLRYLKLSVDRDRRSGCFLVTGSQTFGLLASASESLAGRAAVFCLPPLALPEITMGASLAETDRFLWRGGYPHLWSRPDLDRDLWHGSYVATYLERDVRQVLNVGDLRDFDRFIRAAALRSGQLVSYADLARDVGIAPNTAKRWLSVLQASQQVLLLEPYHRQRAKRLIKAPKLYFVDAGLLCYLLGFRDPGDVARHVAWGAIWETFVIAEVWKRLRAARHPPPLWFWRTAHGDEVDLVVEIGPETFVAVECKTAERVTATTFKGIGRLAEEYGSQAVPLARAVCRTDRAYPVEGRTGARAVPLGGPEGLLAELERVLRLDPVCP